MSIYKVKLPGGPCTWELFKGNSQGRRNAWAPANRPAPQYKFNISQHGFVFSANHFSQIASGIGEHFSGDEFEFPDHSRILHAYWMSPTVQNTASLKNLNQGGKRAIAAYFQHRHRVMLVRGDRISHLQSNAMQTLKSFREGYTMSGRQLAEELANPKVKISRSAKIGQDMSEESFFGAMGLLGNISHLFK